MPGGKIGGWEYSVDGLGNNREQKIMTKGEGKLMSKAFIVTLTIVFALGIGSTAFAAVDPDYAREIEGLKTRIVQLEQAMKAAAVKKEAKEENRLNFDGSDFRIRWIKDGANKGDSTFQERVRLNMNYLVNDDVAFNARWRVENENELGKTGSVGKDGYMLSDANVIMKNVIGTTMTLGRFSQGFGATGYWNSTTIGLIDGAKVSFGKDLKVTVGFANFGAYTAPKDTVSGTKIVSTHTPTLEDAIFIDASYATSKATTLYAMLVQERTGVDSDFDVQGFGIRTRLDDNFQFLGDYATNYGKPHNPTGWYLSLRWRGADSKAPGSFGMRFDYRKIKDGNMFSTSGTNSNIPTMKFQGPALSAHYAIAKNVVVEGFQTFNTKDADTGKSQPNYSRLQVLVGF